MGSGWMNDYIFILWNNAATEKNLLDLDLVGCPEMKKLQSNTYRTTLSSLEKKKKRKGKCICMLNIFANICINTDKCGAGNRPNS